MKIKWVNSCKGLEQYLPHNLKRILPRDRLCSVPTCPRFQGEVKVAPDQKEPFKVRIQVASTKESQGGDLGLRLINRTRKPYHLACESGKCSSGFFCFRPPEVDICHPMLLAVLYPSTWWAAPLGPVSMASLNKSVLPNWNPSREADSLSQLPNFLQKPLSSQWSWLIKPSFRTIGIQENQWPKEENQPLRYKKKWFLMKTS